MVLMLQYLVIQKSRSEGNLCPSATNMCTTLGKNVANYHTGDDLTLFVSNPTLPLTAFHDTEISAAHSTPEDAHSQKEEQNATEGGTKILSSPLNVST